MKNNKQEIFYKNSTCKHFTEMKRPICNKEINLKRINSSTRVASTYVSQIIK